MATLVFGQKRKARAALNNALQVITKANETAAIGDHTLALSRYDEAIKMLQDESYQQWLASGLIQQSVWNDHLASARLGRVRAVVALDPRKTVFEQAEKMLFDVFAIKPDWHEPAEFLAGLAVARGYASNASHYINRLLASNPRHQRARFLQAVLDFDSGKYESAVEKLAALPESAESLCYLGRCRLKTGRVEAAIRTLERARSRFGETYDLSYFYGCALAHMGRFEEAGGLFVSAAAIDPRRPEPNLQLGNLSLVIGRTADAERYFASALNLSASVSMGVHYGMALIASATASERFKLHVEAIGLVDPDSDLLQGARGDAHERAGLLEDARREYASIPRHSPMYPLALTRIGFMSYRSGDYAAALGALRRAAELRPGDNRLLDLLGAAAVQTGDYQLASNTWAILTARNAADEKTTRGIKRLRFWTAVEKVNQGNTLEAVGELEELYRKSGEDEAAARVLGDLYFASAVDLLEADPPDTHRAKELLLLGKHLCSHPRLDYAMALADLMQGHNQTAASRLRLVLAANAKNPGASYHLGVALLRTGDMTSAENALRHGIAVSLTSPSRTVRMKWALAVLLTRELKWRDALLALEELEPEEGDTQPAPVEVLDLKIRCLSGLGYWEGAERLAIGAPSRQQTALGAIVLARRNMKSGRLDAALSHVARFLSLSRKDGSATTALVEKVLKAVPQLGVKAAAIHVREGRMAEAEEVLRNALAALTEMGQPAELHSQLNGFLGGLRTITDDGRRVKRLAQGYESIPVELIFEAEDVEAPEVNIPVVLPLKSHRVLDPNDRPPFNPAEWDCSPNPDPLVVFDS
jgi:tetratricopeptide (TPR) repeat protein